MWKAVSHITYQTIAEADIRQLIGFYLWKIINLILI